jgi:serine/threonine protein phosphatase 1
MKLYAIGDIHGCETALYKMMKILIDDIGGDKAKIVFLGDYVDRGPNSAGVIQALIDLKNYKTDNIEFVFLMGNHDQWFLEYLNNRLHLGDAQSWHYNGGDTTLNSYRDNLEYDIQIHKKFLNENLVPYHEHGEFVFVHAGCWPGTPIDEQPVQDLIWSRDWQKYDGEFYDNKFIVHGHTPVEKPLILKNQMDIDTGCVFGKSYSEYGNLTAVRLDSRTDFKFFTTREFDLE